MITQDAALWQSWSKLEDTGWQPARGISLDDLQHWRKLGRQLAVIDITLPNLPAWNDLRWLSLFNGLRVLVLTPHVHDQEGQQVLLSGAAGYAHAHMPVASLASVINSIHEGSIWLGRSLLQRLLQDIDQRIPSSSHSDWSKGLSSREQEVARYASIGHSNSDIAQILGITERTVRAHLSAVFEKMDVKDRLKLALKVHGIQH